MAVEVQFEALPQHLFVDLADPSLPGGAGVRHHDVDAAEGRDHPSEGVAHASAIGDVAFHRQGGCADGVGRVRRGALVAVKQRHLGARRHECLGGRPPDRAAAAGDDGDLASERLFRRAAELGLFQRPIFHVEHLRLRDRLEAADRLGIGDDLGRALREIGGDLGVLLRTSKAEQAEAGHERDARQRVEWALDPAGARILSREIGLVALAEVAHRRLRGALEIIHAVACGCDGDERPVLGADGVVGRYHAGLAVARELGAVDEVEDRGAGAELENHAPPRAFDLLVLAAASPAQDRRHGIYRGDRLRQLRGHEHRLAVLLQPLLGQCDQRDHALVGFARAGAEGEDAMLVEDQALDLGLGFVDVRRRLREAESRHHVGHQAHAPIIESGADRFAVGLVDDAQDRIGVGVVDEFVRQERMQQDLDRRIRRRGLEQARALDAQEVLVAQVRTCAQLAQTIEPHGGKPRRLNRRHVRARALDAQHRDLLAEKVRHRGLQRGVAAAVQHELGVTAEQARGVDAQR